jgi:hypothetical protein
VGNQLLRTLASQRKTAFDKGNFTEKRALALEIVHHIQGLDPPGRFLKKTETSKDSSMDEGPSGELINGIWEHLSDERAIHKTCQVMRDIARPDRKHREERKQLRKQAKLAKSTNKGGTVTVQVGQPKDADLKDEATIAAEQAAVEVVDKALASTEHVEI